jgi:DUF218 domain
MDRLDESEIARINAEHLITTPLRRAGLLFVFGTREGVPQFVEAILDLWRRRLFATAIVSGGVTPGSALSECAVIKAALVARGVPDTALLEEHEATNTGENVLFSLPVIERAVGLACVRSVICLGKICTSRRYPMTLHRHWPEVHKMLLAVNYFETPVSSWHRDPAFRARVLSEDGKIRPYLERGFIAPWP